MHALYCANAVCGGPYPSDRPAPSGVLSHMYASGPTVKVDSSYLSNTRRFRFEVQVIDGVALVPGIGFDFTNSHRDWAPDSGKTWWTYDVTIGPNRLLVKRFSTVPKVPRAGREFAVRMSATRKDTGATIFPEAWTARRKWKRSSPAKSETFAGGRRSACSDPAGTRGRPCADQSRSPSRAGRSRGLRRDCVDVFAALGARRTAAATARLPA